jgi:hypothetical protein
MMKRYRLINEFKGNKKGTIFYVVAESEFIGVKEFVLRTEDLRHRLLVSEDELVRYFLSLNK